MRNLYTTKWINRPEMKLYLVLEYTLPSRWSKSTQVEIQNDGGSLGLVMSLKTRSSSSHLIKRESLMFSLRQYCLDFPIFTMIDSKFHFSPIFTSNLFFWTRNINICMLFAGCEVRMVKSISRPRYIYEKWQRKFGGTRRLTKALPWPVGRDRKILTG